MNGCGADDHDISSRQNAGQTNSPLADRLFALLLSYVLCAGEEGLDKVRELGCELGRCAALPEHVAQIFGEALQRLLRGCSGVHPEQICAHTPALLMGMFGAYGMAFRQEEAARRQAGETDPSQKKYRHVDFGEDTSDDRSAQPVRMQLEAALDEVAESIVIVDRSRVTECANSATEKMSGYVQDELIGQSLGVEVRLEEQLFQSHKMEAIGILTGGIAHDFNNILSAIMGYTELALVNLPQESSVRRHLETVLCAGHRAAELVHQILAFSRRNERERKPVNIGPILREAIKLLRASLPGTIEISHDVSDEHATVLAEPTQIHRVIMNLCTNSVHAMKERGGVLKIGLSEVGLEAGDIRLRAGMPPGCYLELIVADTGHGIPSNIIHRIFDPFFTTKERNEGTGMGLSIVHGIVKRHGGWIDVESSVGGGTTFRTYLPRYRTLAPPAIEETGEVPQGRRRLLLVDDEAALVRLWEKQLTGLGYEVVGKTGGREALEVFRAQPQQFDAVVTNYIMPHMTGMELKTELTAIRPDIPIILCTGYGGLLEPEEAEASGISAFLQKPLLVREMAQTLRRVLLAVGAVGKR